MDQQQNEENHQSSGKSDNSFNQNQKLLLKMQEKSSIITKETNQGPKKFKTLKTCRSNLNFKLVSFLLLLLFIKNSNCACQNEFVYQKIYVASRSSCQMKFDVCQDSVLMQCTRLQCNSNNQNCVEDWTSQSYNTCGSFCCQSYSDPKNNNNLLSYKFCNSTTSSTLVPLGTILVAVCTTAFIGTLIFLCICRKIRNRNRQQQNQNVANPIQPVMVSTAVDLKLYKVDNQGPYFIDSKQTCVICLDAKVNLRTHCGHYYHGDCLLAWLKKKPDNPCPLCMGMKYNPIKVYCVTCRAGDILVNIQHNIPGETVKNYDSHKCQNCKNLNQKSFTLNDENLVYDENKSDKIKKQTKKQQKNSQEIHQGKNSKRRKRTIHRKQSQKGSSVSQPQDVRIDSFDHLNKNTRNKPYQP